jgi:hypothetical protein
MFWDCQKYSNYDLWVKYDILDILRKELIRKKFGNFFSQKVFPTFCKINKLGGKKESDGP